MAFTPFLNKTPVGLAAGTKKPLASPAMGQASLPGDDWTLDPYTMTRHPGREGSYPGLLQEAWALPALGGVEGAQDAAAAGGYQLGTRNLGSSINEQALFNPQGQQLANRTYDNHSALTSSDYGDIAALAAKSAAVVGAGMGVGNALGLTPGMAGAAPVVGAAAPVSAASAAVPMGEYAVGGAGLGASALPAAAATGSTAVSGVGGVASGIGNAMAKNPGATAALVSALTGGGGSGSAPVLDAERAAAAQGQANRDTSLFDTYLNRPDQVTPQGTLKWTLKPGADPKNPQPGDWVQTTALSETGQQLMDADQQLQLGMAGTSQSALGRVNDTLNSPLDTSGLSPMGQVSDFTGSERQRIEDALMARLQPGFAQDEEAMRSRTLNTGFELGSEGSQREQFRLDQAKNDARLAAIAQSGSEAERLNNISRSNATFQNQSRQQGLQEILAERALPLNELNALRNGTQIQQPQFSPVSQSNTAAAPVMEALMAQLQGRQANAANKQSGYNALLASLAQLGGSYFGS